MYLDTLDKPAEVACFAGLCHTSLLSVKVSMRFCDIGKFPVKAASRWPRNYNMFALNYILSTRIIPLPGKAKGGTLLSLHLFPCRELSSTELEFFLGNLPRIFCKCSGLADKIRYLIECTF